MQCIVDTEFEQYCLNNFYVLATITDYVQKSALPTPAKWPAIPTRVSRQSEESTDIISTGIAIFAQKTDAIASQSLGHYGTLSDTNG
jgi:hypothetical protein